MFMKNQICCQFFVIYKIKFFGGININYVVKMNKNYDYIKLLKY